MQKTLALLLAATAMTPAAMADTLTRVASVPLGAEITGLYLEGADLFMNTQHPDPELGNEFAKASVGVIANADWAAVTSPVPASDADKARVISSLGAFRILLQEGDAGIVGVIKTAAGEDMFTSNDPDFNGFIPTGGGAGLLFTNWENRPGGMSRARMSRSADGRWSVQAVDAVDFSAVAGTWVNCFGTVSPWATPLSAEELYFDDTGEWNNPDYKYHDDNLMLAKYLGHYPNPYDYGYIVEITDPAGAATPVKHFAMGRYSHENAVVMPDNRTAYLSDDGSSVVFFKFVADLAGDMSSGTLYAAKITQDGPAGSDPATTALDIEWIELAHGSNSQIEAWINGYDGIGPDAFIEGRTSYITDAEIAAWAAGEAADDRVAFLESRKAAVAMGATGEFNKMEGVNINHAGAADGSVPFMYMAMSDVSTAMSDGEGDIDLAANKCGVVYAMALGAEFNTTRMVPVVAGFGYDKANAPNACSVDGISNPDNLIVLEDGRVVIGEDTSNHENNMLWIWSRS